MADRYWVGGTANWDATAGTKWATTSGGTGGAAVPTSADNVFFDANSGASTVTVSATANCASLNFTGFTGTLAGTSSIQIRGNVTISSGMTWTHTGILSFLGSTVQTLTSNGKSITSSISVGNSTSELSLADALSTNRSITVNTGTFTTNNYNVTAASFSSSGTSTRTINLGSSTVTLTGPSLTWDTSTNTNLTLNTGTSTIILSGSSSGFYHGGNVGSPGTFYNVSFTNTAIGTVVIEGELTFNNLTVAGRTSAGISIIRIQAGIAGSGNKIVNGTLTLSAGTDATMRTFVQSNAIGTTRTLTCASIASLTDIDFRDITIAGAAAPVSGTRLGDCKGNSGITFPAAKTVYWNLAGNQNWNATGWALASGGTPAVNNFPLAQDTAIFTSSSPISGFSTTINVAYNIGTIDFSARTGSSTLTATITASISIYGNWINGTGITMSGTNTLTFAGRGNQTITSAGKTFTQAFTVDSPSGSVTLLDAFVCSRSAGSTLLVRAGTFDANGYNVTLTGALSQVSAAATTTTRQLNIGSGTWTIAGSNGFSVVSTNFTVTGTGTISLTSASAKTFDGGGVSYSGITLDQGGAGALTISGSNTFKDITNTYSATGATSIRFTSGTTTILSQFSATGAIGKVLTLGATTTSRATLQKGSSWLMGANSTDGGNNLGLSFTSGGGIDYLSVSYINGTVVAPPPTSTGNFFFFF